MLGLSKNIVRRVFQPAKTLLDVIRPQCPYNSNALQVSQRKCNAASFFSWSFVPNILRAVVRLLRPWQTCDLTLVKNTMLAGTFYDLIKPPEDLEQDFQRACAKSEMAVIELLIVIKRCIEEISKEYRNCLDKQVEITLTATDLGPVGSHWEDMTKYRVQAKELKQELESYDSLLRSLSQMAHEQARISFLTGVKDSPDNMNERYKLLRKSLEEELQENVRHESKLLSVNRESILKSGKIN